MRPTRASGFVTGALAVAAALAVPGAARAQGGAGGLRPRAVPVAAALRIDVGR